MMKQLGEIHPSGFILLDLCHGQDVNWHNVRVVNLNKNKQKPAWNFAWSTVELRLCSNHDTVNLMNNLPELYEWVQGRCAQLIADGTGAKVYGQQIQGQSVDA